MKPNFRIKDRLQFKNQKPQNLNHQPETSSYHDTLSKESNSEQIKLSSLLQSFQKIISSLVNSNQPKTSNQRSPKNTNLISNRSDQVDFRDRFVIIDLPDFYDRNVDQEKLETWLGELCSQILSVAFHYLTEKKINYDQMKAFASESFLRNLVILAENADFTSKDMEFIDTKMKEKIFPYLITKYPLTVETEINKNLQASVKSIDNSQMVENDYLYLSGVVFDFRQNGRYDDLIMKLLNEIIVRCDGKSTLGQDSVSNFKEFEKLMTRTFEKSFELEWMSPEKTKQNTPLNQQDFDQLEQKIKESQKYKEHVKQYTSYLIGRKISENTRPYTDDQIQSKSIKIKSPAILRILTKWCEELWSKFENQNYFWEIKDGLSLNGKQSICLIEESVKRKLTEQMKKEKEGLSKFNEKIKKVNYTQQLKLLELELSRKESLYIEKYERVSGLFACKIVNNLQSFIIDYLNSLIHGLVGVSKNVYKNLSYYERLIIPVPLNLLSFKISDILRCKYASKEKEVLKVFGQIQRISKEHPDKFKIIRIKNRLQLSTNDILINAKFNNQINCQIQIAVNTTHSDFIQCSNKINHFIYELQRAQFGPVLQMCSIWKICEKRSDVFAKMIEKQQPRKKKVEKTKIIEKIKGKTVSCRNPFVCSQCNLHYYSNDFIVSHQSDDDWQYWKCAQCLISQNIASQNLEFFLKHGIKNKAKQMKNYSFCKDGKVPQNGAFIVVNKPAIEVNIFKKLNYKRKDYLISLKEKQLVLMKTITQNKDREQFFRDCVVFSLPEDIVDQHFGKSMKQIEEQLISTVILPNYLRNCLNESRQAISVLSEKHLKKVDIQKVVLTNSEKLKNIKSIEFSESGLENLELISPSFTNLSRLILNKNQIKDISRLCEFKNLQRIDLSENKISQIPDEIHNLVKVEQLIMRKNEVEYLPQGFFELKSLKVLNMSGNKLKLVQSFSKIATKSGYLTNLTQLNLSWNKLTEIPEQLGDLINLTQLDLSWNQLTQIPQKLGDLVNLTHLALNCNQLTAVPERLGNLLNLSQLDLSSNELTTLPQILGALCNLIQLYLSGNKLTLIPEKLSGLSNLMQLQLSSNQLTEIPQKLGDLSNLSQLNLYKNQLTTIPEKLGELSNLTQLNLSCNQLATIPEKLGDLSNLIQLNLRQNKLTEIPEELGDLSKLTQLDLRSNQLTAIPERLGDLSNLTQLNLRQNKLTTLPENLGNLSNLTQLNLYNNQLTAIPDKFGELTNLTQLNLNKNQLTSIPDKLGDLQNLTELDLNQNQLTTIPQKLIQRFPQLKLLFENINTIALSEPNDKGGNNP